MPEVLTDWELYIKQAPADYLNPTWDNSRVHNWHNYIDPYLAEVWVNLSEETRAVAAIMANDRATNEEWN